MKIRTLQELDQEQNIKILQKELKEMYLKYDKCSPSPDKSQKQLELINYERRITEIKRRKKVLNNRGK